jgi:tRNA(Glu) U13 pseudouridine synthase TruD
MKTTQVEFLTQLSSAETIEKHLVAARKAIVARTEKGDNRPTNTFIALQVQMANSEEARSYLHAAAVVAIRVIAQYAGASDKNAVIKQLMSLFAGAYADGVEYAASLIDASAESVVN